VLDLFAGTGALGIEAVSRGAAFTLFVDNGAEARRCCATMSRRSASAV
jgi:16S rRNA (guanine966-N2)-methyltransferase